MKKKVALITGIGGQDGFYLAHFLYTKGYEIHGFYRSNSKEGLDEAVSRLGVPVKLHFCEMTDTSLINNLVKKIKPDEVYNLAAQSHVGNSFKIPEYTANVNALGTLRLLEALRIYNKNARFYQASTSEMFGKVQEIPQNEKTPFHPRSPYGVAKLFAHWITINYRESYGMFACSGILFNHESPKRGNDFVTQKIVKSLVRIKSGENSILELGNLDAKRDWGHAKDYVRAMWLMLQQEKPQDFVISSGVTRTVRDFVEEVCKRLEIDIKWIGKGIKEIGVNRVNKKVLVKINKNYFRPAEVDLLLGNSNKAKRKLKWQQNFSFKMLVDDMVNAEIKNHGK